jgi:hypothetical protein
MANGSHHYQAAREVTVTTTGNIDNLNTEGVGLLRMNNASLSTIRGLVAGYAGQHLTIVSIGAGQVDLAHQDTNSTAANRLLNTVTTVSTPLAPGTGYATYVYDDTTARWRLVAHEQGAWINVPFAAGNFTANGAMTWTVASGDVLSQSFRLTGKTLLYMVRVFVTTVGGVVSDQLSVALPAGYVSTVSAAPGVGRASDNGTDRTIFLRASASGTTINCSIIGVTNWTLSTDNTAIDFNVSLQVN